MSKCNKTFIICNKAPTNVTNVIIHLPNVMYPMLSPTLAPVLASSWGGSRWENRTWGACWNFLRPSLNSCVHIKTLHYYNLSIYCKPTIIYHYKRIIRPRKIHYLFLRPWLIKSYDFAIIQFYFHIIKGNGSIFQNWL